MDYSCFRYQRNQDGDYHLQTIRYESIELTQELIDQKCEEEDEEQPDDKLSDSSNDDTSDVDEHGQESNDSTVESIVSKPSTNLVEVSSYASHAINTEPRVLQDNVSHSWGFSDTNDPSDSVKSSHTVLATISGPTGINHIISVLVDDGVDMPLAASGES